MNFNNIKKICLKELKETMNNSKFKIIYSILLIFIILFNFIISDFSLALLIIMISLFMILFMVASKFNHEMLLGRFQSLMLLPMSLKEICLGKYLSIAILVSFYLIIFTFVSVLSFFLNNRININLIIILILFTAIIFLYFSMTSLLQLKYKNNIIYQIIMTIPFLFMLPFTLSLNYEIDISYILNLLPYLTSNIIPIELIIILILLPIITVLLNTLNKEKIFIE